MSSTTFRDSLGVLCVSELFTVGGRAHQVAVTHEAEWNSMRSFFGSDVRVTSSSRLPGKAIVGIVHHRGGSKLTRCSKCGGSRYDLGGPHAPQVVFQGTMRDCVGDLWVDGVEQRRAA